MRPCGLVPRSFRKLQDCGLIERIGSRKAGYWRIVGQDKKILSCRLYLKQEPVKVTLKKSVLLYAVFLEFC